MQSVFPICDKPARQATSDESNKHMSLKMPDICSSHLTNISPCAAYRRVHTVSITNKEKEKGDMESLDKINILRYWTAVWMELKSIYFLDFIGNFDGHFTTFNLYRPNDLIENILSWFYIIVNQMFCFELFVREKQQFEDIIFSTGEQWLSLYLIIL